MLRFGEISRCYKVAKFWIQREWRHTCKYTKHFTSVQNPERRMRVQGIRTSPSEKPLQNPSEHLKPTSNFWQSSEYCLIVMPCWRPWWKSLLMPREMVWRSSRGMIGGMSRRVSWGMHRKTRLGMSRGVPQDTPHFVFNCLMWEFFHKGFITNYFLRMMWCLRSSHLKALVPFLSIDLGIATFRWDFIQLKHLWRSSFMQIYWSLALSGKKK